MNLSIKKVVLSFSIEVSRLVFPAKKPTKVSLWTPFFFNLKSYKLEVVPKQIQSLNGAKPRRYLTLFYSLAAVTGEKVFFSTSIVSKDWPILNRPILSYFGFFSPILELCLASQPGITKLCIEETKTRQCLSLDFWIRSDDVLIGFSATERNDQAVFDNMNFLSNSILCGSYVWKLLKVIEQFNKKTLFLS